MYGIVTDIFWMHNYSLFVSRYSFPFAQNIIIEYKIQGLYSTVRYENCDL